jgi:DNA-damage-inducible protein J
MRCIISVSNVRRVTFMEQKVRLNINLDSRLKNETAQMLDRLGLDFTTAINIFFIQIVKKRKIPFEISDTCYVSVEEVAGENWRDNLDKVEDEWE